MKYLFFLIIFLLPIGLAYGEVGKNYDDINITPNVHQWTSHYERIFDGDQWVNYILTNDANQIQYNSSGISFVYDKNNCNFKLYDVSTNTLAVSNYNFNIQVDSIPQPLTSCNIIEFTQSEDAISFKVDYEEFTTNFDLKANTKLEWTHEITNQTGLVSIIETCNDCIVKETRQDKISNQIIYDFGSYTLDLKNEIHGTLKETKQIDNIFTTTFEKIITNEEKLIIDPTFTSSNPSVDGFLSDTGNNDICDGNTLTKDTTSVFTAVGRQGSGSVDDCYRAMFEYDITSITDGITVTDTDFTFDVDAIFGDGADLCDYVGMGTQPTVGTNANLWTSITGDTVLVNADASCDTPANNVNVDLSATGDTYIEGKLGVNWAAIGIKRDTEGALDGTTRWGTILAEEEATATPKPTLTVVYLDPVPTQPTNVKANVTSYWQIDLSWTAGNCYTGCNGYRIFRETPLAGGFSTLVSNTTNTTTTYSDILSLSPRTQYNYLIAGINPTGVGANSSTTAASTNTTYAYIGAVTDLTSTDIRPTGIDLSWTVPTVTGANIVGYQINYTTPFNSNVASVAKNDTALTSTTYTVSNLTGTTNGTDYSFRVGAWVDYWTYKNMSGNVYNVTLDPDPTVQFTVGSFDISQVNTDVIDIRFEREVINDSSSFVNVTYRNTYNLACDLEYRLGQFNQTYTNLSNVTIDSSHVESSFLFRNVTNDIIYIDCWDQNDPDNNGQYLVERYDTDSFPLLVQFEQFRDGTFGTAGMFGFFDMITLATVVLSMIGFNRVNPAVGVIFCVVVITFLGYFEIIEMPTIIFSALALVVMLAIGVTRSDQN